MLKNLYIMAAMVLTFLLTSTAVFAQDAVISEDMFCVTGLGEYSGMIAAAIGTVVVVASTLANIIGKTGFLGRLVHFLALNVTVEKKK